MSDAWNMHNIWPWFYWSWGSRPTIGSFVYLIHIVGHFRCLTDCMDLGCLKDSQLCHTFLMRLSSVADTQSSATMGISLEHDVFVYNTYTKYWYYKKVHHKSIWNFAEGFFTSPTEIYKHMSWFWTTDCIPDRNRTCRKRVNWGKMIPNQC